MPAWVTWWTARRGSPFRRSLRAPWTLAWIGLGMSACPHGALRSPRSPAPFVGSSARSSLPG
eukprot:6498693-Alexandrium_andersonii.AAC.1